MVSKGIFPAIEIGVGLLIVGALIYVVLRSLNQSRGDHGAISKLPDPQLRATTLEFTPHMRRFEIDRRTAEEAVIAEYLATKQNPPPKYNEDRAFHARKQKVSEMQAAAQEAWKKDYLRKATQLRHELEHRVGRKRASQLHDERYRLVAFDGQVTGNDPIAAAAGYLEALARELPAE
jgi:hypothetical protein